MDSTTSNFAQRLAGNEKKIRDRAIGRLRKYLSLKADLSELDMLKLWKGLHYCLWMQDKPLLQEQLVSRIVDLVDCLPHQTQAFLFLQTFFLTEGKEWNRVDLWRLDKFMMLVRQMTRRGLELVRKSGWSAGSLTQWNAVVARVMGMDDEVAEGLRFHLADLYLDEVARVGGSDLSQDSILTLLQPFQHQVCRGKNKVLVKRVLAKVLQPLCQDLPCLETEDDVGESLVPTLQVTTQSLTDLLMTWGGYKSSRNRALLFALVKRIRDGEAGLVQGQREEEEGEDVTDRDVDRASQSLQAFHHRLIQAKLRHKENKKKNKAKKAEENGDGFEEEHAEEEVDEAEGGADESEEETEEAMKVSGDAILTEPSRKKAKKSRKKARKAVENGEGAAVTNLSQEGFQTPAVEDVAVTNLSQEGFQTPAVEDVAGTNLSQEGFQTPAVEDVAGTEVAEGDLQEKSQPATPSGKKRRNKKRKLTDADAPPPKKMRAGESPLADSYTAEQTSVETSTTSVEMVDARSTDKPTQIDREVSPSAAQSSDKLQPGEVEIWVPSKKYTAKLKQQEQKKQKKQGKKGESKSEEGSPAGNKSSPASAIFGPLTPVASPQGSAVRLSRNKASARSLSQSTKSSATPSSEKKKVNFNLSQNLSIAFNASDAASPQPFTPAFSPSRQPQSGILKLTPPTTRSAARKKAAAKMAGQPKIPSPAAGQRKTGNAKTLSGKRTGGTGSVSKMGAKRDSGRRMSAADFF